jgi:hypothetical protein
MQKTPRKSILRLRKLWLLGAIAGAIFLCAAVLILLKNIKYEMPIGYGVWEPALVSGSIFLLLIVSNRVARQSEVLARVFAKAALALFITAVALIVFVFLMFGIPGGR